MRAVFAPVTLLLLAGCTTPPPVVRVPAMPTVRAAAPAPGNGEGDKRLTAEAIEAARAGQSADATAKLAQIPEPSARLRAAEHVVRELAEANPALAAALALALESGPAQANGLALAARAWAPRDERAALAWAAAIREPVAAGVALREVAEVIVRRDPRAALAQVEALPEELARADARIAVGAAWARMDPAAALDWLGGQRDDPRLRAAMIFAVGQVEPRRASGLLRELPAGRERAVLAASIGQTWVAQDRAAAMAWAGDLAVGAERDAAFAGIETGLGVPAVRRRAGVPGQRTIRSRGQGGGEMILRGDFPEFTAWLATQPPEREREEVLVEFVRQRGPADTGAIGRWLAGLPGSTGRDRALQIYLEGRLTGSPAEAAAFLRELPRSDVSDAMIEQVARRWLITNPDAAVPWLRDTNVPGFLKDRLLREAGR